MDYVVGSVAALISGNVTPNRPKLIRRALTPTKHQPSPNVTPKSEFVDDRSIFLSPTMQKKKAIVKKSPKRIFQNPEVDGADEEGNTSSPKADKVKKHLKEDLESSDVAIKVAMSPKSPKKKLNKSSEDVSQSEKPSLPEDMQRSNENTPRKKKKGSISNAEGNENAEPNVTQDTEVNKSETTPKGPKNKKKQKKNNAQSTEQVNDNKLQKSPNKKTEVLKQDESTNMEVDKPEVASTNNKKKRRKKNKKNKPTTEVKPTDNTGSQQTNNIKKGKNKNKQVKAKEIVNPNSITTEDTDSDNEITESEQTNNINKDKIKKIQQPKTKDLVNPNAITAEDTDSEHDSDDEIESENEEINKEILDTPAPEDSSDEEENDASKSSKPKEKKEVVPNVSTEEELKRTLFVGNVPFSSKCKKEIKKIFGKHGQIETIRIRTIPVKDARVTPKLAVIKEELHPERSTVNVYIKYKDTDSIYKALIENNTVLNDHHLRVSRSDTTGAEHDPNCSVFVGNLPFALEDETFRATFEKCGEIDSVRIIRDKKTNAGKGFGYINFASKDGVELALALTEEDLTIKNRIMRVKRCTLTNKQGGPNQRGMGNKRGFGNRGGGQRGGIQSERGGFQSQRGGFNNQRGGNSQRGFNSHRGGSFQRGGNSQRGGSFQRGGNSQRGGNFQRGGFNNRRGGFNRGDSNTFEHNKEQNDNEGALRRIKNKRPNSDGGDGPPNKKEKKTRQEFVGMTAEKKKKTKFDKGLKKKKQLSEILTK